MDFGLFIIITTSRHCRRARKVIHFKIHSSQDMKLHIQENVLKSFVTCEKKKKLFQISFLLVLLTGISTK